MTFRFSQSVVIGVLGTLGVVAWSGCGPGGESRYYCDASGCYTCDAYGCSAVAPPPSSSPSPPPAPPPVEECTTNADCGNGKTCNAGTCETCGGSAGPCPCTTSNDCEGDLTCVAGACTAPQNTCKYSSECGGGKVCAEGQCLASCETSPCDDGFTCEKGVCQPSGSTGPCTSDAQCTSPDAPTCVGGTCAPACAGDAECGEGKFCDQGACVIDTRPTPNCTTDDQCGGTSATPKKCLDGFCKYTCTTDEYCRTVDNRIGYCAKDGVCRSAAEASAECFGPGECPAGKACVDNTCR